MQPKTIVQLSNAVGAVSIILLIYWIFIFIAVQVFGLKVFRENISETFYLSIFGILALMFGALIINVMMNLTRIADKHNQDALDAVGPQSTNRRWFFILSFPVIFGLLYGGDYLTSRNKEKRLVESAKSILEQNIDKADQLTNYTFTEKWLLETTDILDVMSKTDKNFPYVSVITRDTIDDTAVILSFRAYNGTLADTLQPAKKNFIFATTPEERAYLNRVFTENFNETKFDATNGRYELYYPSVRNNKKVVLYFSDYQRYGKGSGSSGY